MNSPLLIVGVCNIVLGMMCIALSIPLIQRRIKMNRYYGIRIPKSYSSPENWEKINAYGGRAMIVWSIPIIVIGIGTVLGTLHLGDELKPTNSLLVILSLPSLLMLGAFVQVLIWSRKIQA